MDERTHNLPITSHGRAPERTVCARCTQGVLSAMAARNQRYGPVVGQVWQRGLVRIVTWWQERSLGWTAAALACGVGSISVTSDERWLAANWPFVRGSLPAAPARVVEVGCGPLGGFVPLMEAAGYQAIGVDPEAPPGPSYRQVEFERYETAGQLDAIVACTSLHHVADLAGVLDLVAGVLVPGGRAVIVEWARERFDEATARWCFARLPGPDDDPGWLHQRQAEWHESGQPWDACLRSWVHAEGLHAGQDILEELDARFDCRAVAYGPYFFADLAGTSDAEEQAAIDSGLIQANRIQYVGRRKSPPLVPSA